MVLKILRALKATLLRRNPSTLHGCPTACSFYAGPEYPRAADNLHHALLGSSDTRNLMLASPSDAMLATLHLAEIVAQFPDGDDNSDTISIFSSTTNNYSSDEFEGMVRCNNGISSFIRAWRLFPHIISRSILLEVKLASIFTCVDICSLIRLHWYHAKRNTPFITSFPVQQTLSYDIFVSIWLQYRQRHKL